ncbi:hypothetical protein HY988_04390 [Candidatus Micrarchaeota archaeon]|nr:hypothetical protein [Candidatus Micrarchaeota archaeon]
MAKHSYIPSVGKSPETNSPKLAKFTVRIFVLIFLPFVFGAFILPHTQGVIDDQPLNPISNVSGPSYVLSEDRHGSINESTALTKINSIFPLSNYLGFPPFVYYRTHQICFEDRGSNVTYVNGTVYTRDFKWDVLFNKNTDIIVQTNSVSCTEINFNENFSITWRVNIPLSNNNLSEIKSLQFNPNARSYFDLVLDYGILQGLVMIPACYLLIFYPAAGIIKKIQKGMLEQ